MRPRLWFEPFAGTAVVAWRLIGGRRVRQLTGYMGCKYRFADPIFDAFGLHAGQGADAVMLVDAGPWGWAWQGLLLEEVRRAVARLLRAWAAEDPVELWKRLAAQPPPLDLAEGIATWLWLQARSANSCPVWWDDDRASWRMGDKPRVSVPSVGVIPGHQGIQQVPDYAERELRHKGTGAGRCRGMINPATIADRIDVLAHHLATFLCLQAGAALAKPVTVHDGAWKTSGYAHLSESGRAKGFTSRLRPDLLARRVEDLPNGDGRTTFIAAHARAEDSIPQGDLSGCYALIDPPYVGCTGYAADCARDQVVDMARDLQARGAHVAICEAEPLPIKGWHHVDITGHGRGQVWKERRAKGEWLTLSHPPVRVPAQQLNLLASSRCA